jgi:formiminotetrahydrofolate cyclodeaminase
MIGDRTIQAFLDDLASKAATPGGGSAAAVMGAMGAALVSMVCRLTIGRQGYESVDAELRSVLAEAEKSRARLAEMVRLDVEAVDSVMRAYRLPKDTPAAVAARDDAIQAALRVATDVPVDCARASAAVIALARTAAEKGNRTAVSDAGAGALAAQAALRSAALNVYSNTALMTDRAYADTRARAMDALLAEGASRVKEIWPLLTGHG